MAKYGITHCWCVPAIAGYPTEELYVRCKPHFYNGRYQFDYEHHTFFGECVEIQLFDYPEYAYVFVDTTQAQSLLRKWRQDHWEQWMDLTDKEQDWFMVKDGCDAHFQPQVWSGTSYAMHPSVQGESRKTIKLLYLEIVRNDKTPGMVGNEKR
ncbi:MAG: hypothetical protein IJ719_05915 [Clostridia bacterium]|nr:hypothetical protein [Clostridia bacterium]